jgi:pyridinium-3,5-biscarboxylic acid mononucleotide synthase
MNLDTDRLQRQGFPEVVYGRGKTRQQMIDALTGLHQAHGHALATRVEEDLQLPGGHYDPASKLYRIGHMPERAGKPLVVSAGTADQPVAEEAAQTLEFLGYQTQRIADVGVAGLHRLLSRLNDLNAGDLLIVVAGMEGALPSVVGGLVSQPLIAVPTSTGYGSGAQGIAALLSMLNSCAAGITVVNIDNGFGAALAAHRILLCRS